jgi:PTS system nitrogen regulatory IIA component
MGRPVLSLCFLDQPIDYGALDGLPVHTLFTIISPTTRAHLHLMAKLAFLLRVAEVQQALQGQASRPEILAQLRRAEESLAAVATTAADAAPSVSASANASASSP